MPYFKPRNEPPRGNNASTSREAFYEEEAYQRFYPDDENSISFRDFPYYGRADLMGRAIFPRQSLMRPVNSGRRRDVFVFAFVAQAYDDMRAYIKRKSEEKAIDISKSFLSSFSPTKGYYRMNDQHNGHVRLIFQEFSSKFLNNLTDDEFYSFPDLYDQFKMYLRRFAGKFRLSRSGFILSEFSYPRLSGLVIDHENRRHGNDAVKVRYIRDPLFGFYARTARQFGFFVDKDSPWRLIADVDSPALRSRAEPFGVDGRAMLEDPFYRAYETDLSHLRTYLVALYNGVVSGDPRQRDFCIKSDGSSAISLRYRPTLTDEEALALGERFWRRALIEIRLIERGRPITSKIETYLDTAEFREKASGRDSALRYIDQVCRLG